MIVFCGVLLVFLAIGMVTTLIVMIIHAYHLNNDEYYDLFELFDKGHTLLTDILSKLISVFSVMISFILLLVGLGLITSVM